MHRDSVEKSMVANLKIAIVSPDKRTMEYLRALLHRWDGSLQFTMNPGEVEHAGRIADQEHPDVLIIEGVRPDNEELLALERVTPRHPNMAVIMVSPNQTPEFLRHAMRIGLREILPVPVAKEALLDAVGRIQQRIALSITPEKKGKVMAFVGCKGGSGATFLATNLAYALAEQEGTQVALLDLNRQFGDAALYVSDCVPTSTLADVTRQVHRLDGSFLVSSMIHVLPNYHVLAAPEEAEQALQIRPEQIDALLSVAESHYDFVVIDAGRSLDEVTVRAMDQSQAIFPVLQLTLPFVRDGKRLLHALGALGYGKDKVKLLVNRQEKKGAISLEDVAETLGREVFRTIPNCFSAVADSINQGVPILKLAPRDPVSKALREMAGALAAVKKGSGWLRGLLPTR
jgi:pilus assembly protein CpaE